MSKTLPRKAVIAISSFNGAIYPGGRKTGLFLTEALHPYEVFVAAGFEVDLASRGGHHRRCLSWASNYAGHHRFEDGQIHHQGQDGDRLHDRRRTHFHIWTS